MIPIACRGKNKKQDVITVMPREAREKSETGVYHIMMRGINHQDIFYDKEDNLRFLDTLQKVKQSSGVTIYGYCLMENHVHLVVKEGAEDISAAMKRLGVGFARWFNWKYERSGHLFQDRYKSEPIERDAYLLTVVRYVHNNPVRARLVTKPEEWRWSSYNAYCGKSVIPRDLVDTSFILGMISQNKSNAIELFKDHTKKANMDKCLEYEGKIKKTDSEVVEVIKKLTDSPDVYAVMKLPKKERDELLRALKNMEGVTCRQLARVLGITASVVLKA